MMRVLENEYHKDPIFYCHGNHYVSVEQLLLIFDAFKLQLLFMMIS